MWRSAPSATQGGGTGPAAAAAEAAAPSRDGRTTRRKVAPPPTHPAPPPLHLPQPDARQARRRGTAGRGAESRRGAPRGQGTRWAGWRPTSTSTSSSERRAAARASGALDTPRGSPEPCALRPLVRRCEILMYTYVSNSPATSTSLSLASTIEKWVSDKPNAPTRHISLTQHTLPSFSSES
jgi:hypothetical protein